MDEEKKKQMKVENKIMFDPDSDVTFNSQSEKLKENKNTHEKPKYNVN